MNNLVFPAYAKQFGVKLQASAWDLPLFPRLKKADTAIARTTGFSGTNDNKSMLPLTINQDDLSSLRHTSAEVLTYLLQPRNRRYRIAARGGKRSTEEDLLEQMKAEGIRILIDAGAYVLEMNNEALVTAWLAIDTEAKVAVYFGSDNRAWVKYRTPKASVPLSATPFMDNLGECLVYLDEAHTRGIDLKLPSLACGALTLALGQTKDHTVQAAMRLRQLASSQSVCFFAFPATHQSILDTCGLSNKDAVDSSHVVHWLLEQTCQAHEHLQNLYITQGMDFCDRTTASWTNKECLDDPEQREAYAKALQRPEQQTLDQLYGPRSLDDVQTSSPAGHSIPQIQIFKDRLDDLRRTIRQDHSAADASALEEVEQEREVEFQVEEVRQVQRPVIHEPLSFHGLHPAIGVFAHTGLLRGGEGYESAFAAIARTVMGQTFGVKETTTRLFVSVEFMRTIKLRMQDSLDNFLRPVEWILYSPATSSAMVIITEEAELLIPFYRTQKTPAPTHLLTYSAPVTKKMIGFSGMNYYALPALPKNHVVPDSFKIELGILAGRLYLDFEECAALKLYIDEDMKGGKSGAFGGKAAEFILEWLSLRRKGQDISHTPVAYICQGRPIHRGHAFFTQPTDMNAKVGLT